MALSAPASVQYNVCLVCQQCMSIHLDACGQIIIIIIACIIIVAFKLSKLQVNLQLACELEVTLFMQC